MKYHELMASALPAGSKGPAAPPGISILCRRLQYSSAYLVFPQAPDCFVVDPSMVAAVYRRHLQPLSACTHRVTCTCTQCVSPLRGTHTL